MKVSVITVGPSVEPIGLEEARMQVRLDPEDTTYDTELDQMITSARTWVERRYGLSLITQTRQQRQDNFYDYTVRCLNGPVYNYGLVKLLNGPVQSVSSVTYVDSDGVVQTLVANTDYATAGLVTPVIGAQDIIEASVYPVNSWPSFKWVPEAIKITYVCGFGVDGSYVPGPIKSAILKVLTHLFEYRADEILSQQMMTAVKFEMSVDRIMASYESFQHIKADV